MSDARDDVTWLDGAFELNRAEEDQLAAADFLALQARGAPLGVDLDEIGAKGERLWFPEITADFLWPFGGQPHLFNDRDATFSEGPFPIELGDAYLNRQLQSRKRLDAIEKDYLALDVAAVVDLDAYKNMALERQGEVDQICGSDFASRIEAEFRTRPLFSNPLAPMPDLLRAVANPLFGRLPGGFSIGDDWRAEGSAALELPIHPSVATHFGLDWAKDRLCRTWAGESVGFAEYVRRYLAYSEGPELEAGLRLEWEGCTEEGVEKLQRAVKRPLGSRSDSAKWTLARAVPSNDVSVAAASSASPAVGGPGEPGPEVTTKAIALHKQGRESEAESETLRLLAKAPGSIEAWLLLAEIRQRRGDLAGRAAALRGAVARRPNDPALQSRLTLACADAGDYPGAAASAEAEVAMDPNNPHPRAFLSAILDALGEKERARTHILRAIEIIGENPRYVGLRQELANRLVEKSQAASPAPA